MGQTSTDHTMLRFPTCLHASFNQLFNNNPTNFRLQSSWGDSYLSAKTVTAITLCELRLSDLTCPIKKDSWTLSSKSCEHDNNIIAWLHSEKHALQKDETQPAVKTCTAVKFWLHDWWRAQLEFKETRCESTQHNTFVSHKLTVRWGWTTLGTPATEICMNIINMEINLFYHLILCKIIYLEHDIMKAFPKGNSS